MSAFEEPVVFGAVVEGMQRAFAPRLSPQLRDDLKAMGLDFEERRAAYPVNDFLRYFTAVADGLYPGDVRSRPARLRQFGQDFMNGFGQTAIGGAAFMMARVVGIRRSMERVSRNVRSTGNFMDASCEVVGPTEVKIITRVRPQFLHHVTPEWRVMALYRIGVIDGILNNLKAKSPRAELQNADDARHETVFRVSWQD
ncbi:MAG: DUF2378 family protein [Archangium sp.]